MSQSEHNQNNHSQHFKITSESSENCGVTLGSRNHRRKCARH